MSLLYKWIIATLAVLAAAYLVPGIIVPNLPTAIVVAAVLGIINATVRPVLFFLTLPITIITLGLFAFVLNALMLSFAVALVPGVRVEGFFAAVVGALLISLIRTIGDSLIKKE